MSKRNVSGLIFYLCVAIFIGSAATRKWRRAIRLRWVDRRLPNWSRVRRRRRRDRWLDRWCRCCCWRSHPTVKRRWSRSVRSRSRMASARRRRCSWTATKRWRWTSDLQPGRWNSWAAGEPVVTCSPTPTRRWTTSTRPNHRPNRASPANCGCTRRRSAACRLCSLCGSCCRRRWPTIGRCRYRYPRKTTSVCVGAKRRIPCWPAWHGCARERSSALPTQAELAARRSRGCWIESVSWPNCRPIRTYWRCCCYPSWPVGWAVWCLGSWPVSVDRWGWGVRTAWPGTTCLANTSSSAVTSSVVGCSSSSLQSNRTESFLSSIESLMEGWVKKLRTSVVSFKCHNRGRCRVSGSCQNNFEKK